MAASIPVSGLADVLSALGDLLTSSPFLEFLLSWTAAVCTHHSVQIQVSICMLHGVPWEMPCEGMN